MVEIRLNGTLLELSDDKELTYTLQVNDIGDVATRQASYTNSFKLPKTKINTETLQGLGQVGDTSRIPYQKPTCELSQGGFPIIPNGWATIKNTDDNYSLNITNGIIDFFKAIENKTLGIHLDLSEINHEKTVATVVNSFTAGLPYRYLIGDYNGKTHYDIDNKILIDYLPSSASVEYLWKKIFTTFGFTYSGTIFNDLRFTDLWLTYPKGVDLTITQPPFKIYDLNNGGFQTPTTGITFNGLSFDVQTTQTIAVDLDNGSSDPIVGYRFRFYINGVLAVGSGIIALPGYLNFSFLYQINAGDNFYTTFQYTQYGQPIAAETITPNGIIEIYRAGINQNFSEELKEFKITDFVKEILNKFCLTMFTDPHSKNIDFKTIKERTEATNIIDWSDKYVERKNETYIYDTYAQKNNFRYQYNDKEDAHNNGFILIDNVNIADSIDVWKSITYSPLKETNDKFLIGTATLPPIKIFKQYDKEVKEAPVGGLAEIKYKPLSKRFYFQRSEQINGTATFGSVLLSNEQTITNGLIQIANFNQLDMNSIIGLSYLPLQSILNDSRLHTIILVLSVFDIMTIDFTALYYFNQEQQYYLLNKIVYKSGELATAEFVRVKRNSQLVLIPNTATFITIDSVVVNGCEITLTYTTDATIGTLVNLECNYNSFGQIPPPTYDPIYNFNNIYVNNSGTNTVVFTLEAGANYVVQMNISQVFPILYSNIIPFDNTAGCVIVSPNNLTITSVTLISQDALNQNYKIDFTTDAILPRNVFVRNYKPPSGMFGGWSNYINNGTATTNSINVSVSTIFGNATKLQIRIGFTQSNEFTI